MSRSLSSLRPSRSARLATLASLLTAAPLTFASFASAAEPARPAQSTQVAESQQSALTAYLSENNQSADAGRDLFADTWVATDALGRQTPTFEEVGPVKNDQRRVVGIFYITWHTQNLATRPGGPDEPFKYDVTRILSEHPEARLDANHPAWANAGSYHWGEPEVGYFLSQDEYVIRRDMSQLADAGVDLIILDVTNAVRYWDEWEVLFKTMQKMRDEGNRVPKFCFWSFNGESIAVVESLYEAYYKTPKYQDLWFYWDGKPLLLYNPTPDVDANRRGIKSRNPKYDAAAKTDENHPHYGDPAYTEEFYSDYSQEVKDFFTLRAMWWGYYKWNGERFVGTEDKWSFGYDLGDKRVRDMNPADLVSTHNGVREQAAVTPAQHPSSLVGKSWSRKTLEPQLDERDEPAPTFVPWLGKTVENPEGYGIYYQERWDEALAANPQFLYINDWNEWTAGKYHTPEVLKAMNFMRRGDKATYFFVDQYNAEFNRCVQPMKGGYTDNYYMQTAQNIRRYKGARPIPTNRGEISFDQNAPLAGWDALSVEYRDTLGDVAWRDAKGYAGLHYVDQTGRNDFTTAKVGVDAENLYFFAEAASDWTPSTDKNWALLFLDADKNAQTGWFGYDYLVNKSVVDETQTTICQWVANADAESGGAWKEVAKTDYYVEKNRLVVRVPRALVGATGAKLALDFKWSDNPTELVDPISLCTAGDTAPNRRFNYRFLWERDAE